MKQRVKEITATTHLDVKFQIKREIVCDVEEAVDDGIYWPVDGQVYAEVAAPTLGDIRK